MNRREFLRFTAASAALPFTLREDDFFFANLGYLKPKCAPLRWAEPIAAETERAGEIARVVREEFPGGALEGREPLFAFVEALSRVPKDAAPLAAKSGE